MAVYISGFQTGTWVNGSNSYVLSSSAIQSRAYSLAANSGTFALTGNDVAPIATWDSANKAAQITLSNGNLTATLPSGSFGSVRGTTSKGSGFYFELTYSSVVTGAGASSSIAVCNSSANLNSYMSADVNSIAYNCNGGVAWNNGSLGTVATWAAGDVIGCLVGTGTGTVKFFKNGVLVFTSSGTSFPSGALFPAVTLGNVSDAETVNFGAKPMSFLPAGATSWDGSRTGAAGSPYSLAAAAGSFALTGNSAGLSVVLPATSGVFTLSGNSAANAIGLPALSGTFALTGQTSGNAVVAPLSSGTFSLAGSSSGEAIGEPAGSGTFALSGRAAALATQLPLTSGVFSLTGNAATITYSGAGNKSLAALSGTFAVTGRLVSIAVGVSVSVGTYTLTGGSVPSGNGYQLAAGSGTFQATGNAAAGAVRCPLRAGAFSFSGFPSVRSIGEPVIGGQYTMVGFRAILQHFSSVTERDLVLLLQGTLDGGSIALRGTVDPPKTLQGTFA
jgi:fibronectin-binding autotransporter adhesin